MLTLKYLREHSETAKKALEKRFFKDLGVIDEILEKDAEQRSIKRDLDDKLNLMNESSRKIGELYRKGKPEEAEKIKQQMTELKGKVREREDELSRATKKMEEGLLLIPNVPHETVPAGKNETDNQEIRTGGVIPDPGSKGLPHWELAEKWDLIRFDEGTKIAGSGFPVYKGDGSKLQRALASYFLDKAIAEGYTEFTPPLLVNRETAYGTGQLPDKDGQMYFIGDDQFFLIPTAEVPLTNLYRDKILTDNDLPVKMVGYTQCFRREAGSYGKEVRGLNRLHQFDKVEIVQIAHPERSYEVLDEMVVYIESLVKSLGLPYRIMRLCGGDLGFTASLTYDFEVFAAAQEKWLEVSSVSNFESFQSNRLKLRYKGAGNKKQLLHTLNGSALAFPRIVAALLENYQTEEGIQVPEVLVPYMGKQFIP